MTSFGSRHTVSELLKESALFCSLPDGNLDQLTAVADHARVPAGDVIFEQEDLETPLYLVVSGRVKVTLSSRSGSELLLSMIEPGELFGGLSILDGAPRMVNAVAERASELAIFPREELRPILEENAQSAIAYSRILSAYLRDAISRLGNLGLNDAKTRLWIHLIGLGERYGTVDSRTGSVRIDHGLSQQSLADGIGLTRVMVNRQLGLWREKGLIEYGRGFVLIREPDLLEARVWQKPRRESALPD